MAKSKSRELLTLFLIFLFLYILVHEEIHIIIDEYYGIRYQVKWFAFSGNSLTDALVEVVPNQEDLARLSPQQLLYWQYLQALNEVIGYSGIFLILLAYLIYSRPRKH